MNITIDNNIKAVLLKNSKGELFNVELGDNYELKDITLVKEEIKEKKQECEVVSNPYEEELTVNRKMINTANAFFKPKFDEIRREYEMERNLSDTRTNEVKIDKNVLGLMWLESNGYFDKVKNMNEKEAYEYTNGMLQDALDFAKEKLGNCDNKEPYCKCND